MESQIELLETDNLEEALELIKKHNLYAISIDGEFYKDKRRMEKGEYADELAQAAKEYKVKNIVGLGGFVLTSKSAPKFVPKYFTYIFSKSDDLSDYIKKLLR